MYNYGMTTVAELSASNAKNIVTENNKRGATIVRVCGEEHSAISTAGIATTYLAHDNDMCFISDYKFKLIFGDGIGNNNPNAPVSTNVVWGSGTWHDLNAFKAKYPLGSAIDVDGAYGCQCVDYANAFWIGQVNRQINCGGDNARGIWTQASAQNAGTEFDLITSWSSLQPGDWIVWGGGTFGHIAMAVTVPNGSEITVWNQNGSGYPWPSGGATLSSDTKSSNGFLGAFRYRSYADNPTA